MKLVDQKCFIPIGLLRQDVASTVSSDIPHLVLSTKPWFDLELIVTSGKGGPPSKMLYLFSFFY